MEGKVLFISVAKRDDFTSEKRKERAKVHLATFRRVEAGALCFTLTLDAVHGNQKGGGGNR